MRETEMKRIIQLGALGITVALGIAQSNAQPSNWVQSPTFSLKAYISGALRAQTANNKIFITEFLSGATSTNAAGGGTTTTFTTNTTITALTSIPEIDVTNYTALSLSTNDFVLTNIFNTNGQLVFAGFPTSITATGVVFQTTSGTDVSTGSVTLTLVTNATPPTYTFDDLSGSNGYAFTNAFGTGNSGVSNSAAPNLGAAASFAVLAGSTVTATTTAGTVVNGDLGVSPGTAVTGFPPGTVVNGAIHAGDPVAAAAQAALTAAYNDAASRTNAVTLAGNIGGMTLTNGVYKSTSSLAISSGNLTLDAQGNSNAVFIFQIASTLTTSSSLQVILANGANPANIFWQVGTSATLGTSSVFEGNILASQSITLGTGATLNGRALASVGAVALDSNPVTRPGLLPSSFSGPALLLSAVLQTNSTTNQLIFSLEYSTLVTTISTNTTTTTGTNITLGTFDKNAKLVFVSPIGSTSISNGIFEVQEGTGKNLTFTDVSKFITLDFDPSIPPVTLGSSTYSVAGLSLAAVGSGAGNTTILHGSVFFKSATKTTNIKNVGKKTVLGTTSGTALGYGTFNGAPLTYEGTLNISGGTAE
jgi:hypothetical protein